MGYRCPIDKFYAKTNSAMVTHMMNNAREAVEHQEWMEAHGIIHRDLVLKGNYAPLKALVERECKIKD